MRDEDIVDQDVEEGGMCKNKLVKPFKNNKGEVIYKPIFVFPYRPLKSIINEFFLRPGFEDMVNHHKSRQKKEGWYFDIYDGSMFDSIKDAYGIPFSQVENALHLTLNIDWFNPFDRSRYSCGAIYLSINNLPREERFKEENIMLVGLMPTGKEASTSDINNYLDLIVNDLIELYDGIEMKTYKYPNGITSHAVLLMVNADIPACRKVAGFLGHSSAFACNRCDRSFDLINGKVNCVGGYDSFGAWNLRRNESNREAALLWLQQKTKADREFIEGETGTRYSALHRLHYFDLTKQCPPDPMHCLLLGTGLRMMKEWKEKGLLSNANLENMQELADMVELPCGFENLNKKIVQGFSSMKADAVKSWILIYSPYVLIGML